MLFIFLYSVLLTVAAFSLVAFYKYFKLFAHDLSHVLPAVLPWHCAIAVALLVLSLPLFWKWSIFLTAFFWLFVFFLYHSRREQQLIITFALFLVLSPLLIQVLSQIIVTNASESFNHAYQVTNENWGDETGPILSKRVREHPADTDALFALALMRKREGRIKEAQHFYSKLLELDPLNCRAWCNLGNTYLAAKQPDSAITHYARSIELCPKSVEAYYNLSRVQLLEYMFAESTKNFNTAKELDAERVDGFLQIYSEHANRQVVDQTPSVSGIWQKTLSVSDGTQGLSADLWDCFYAGVPYRYRSSVIIVFLCFVGLLFVDRQTYNHALACEYCGCAVCRKCKRLVLEYTLCKPCAAIFKAASDTMISIARKEEQVASIERFQGRKIFMGKLLAVLLPGAGHLLFDHPFRGTAILFLFMLLLAKLLFWNMLMVNQWQLISGSPYLDVLVIAIPLSMLYLYSLGHFNFSSMKLFQFLSLIRVTRKELQIKE
jgi:tetratricopeptide (TPR) repeat protein